MKTQLVGLAAAAVVAGAMALTVSSEPKAEYAAHEWGTFTDVQGPDGKQMVWNPLVAPDLPNFVYHYEMRFKTSLQTIQRMETPVLYFYTDRQRKIDVAVDFPKGMITEWFPLKPAADQNPRRLDIVNKRPSLHWQNVTINPTSSAEEKALLDDKRPSHYYAARATDSALVQVEDKGWREADKFLFYRGVGDFQAPLTVTMENGTDGITLLNSGSEPLRNLFVYQVTTQKGVWLSVPKLEGGEKRTVKLPETSAPLSDLEPALRQALVGEGLFEKEAAAMVKTWEDSWFAERGLRVLYTLPRAWTDRTLPLKIEPSPKKIERVMVGRAEIIAPTVEQSLQTLLERYLKAAIAERPAIAKEARELGLGRFFMSALDLARKSGQEQAYYQTVNEFALDVLAKPTPVATFSAKTTAP